MAKVQIHKMDIMCKHCPNKNTCSDINKCDESMKRITRDSILDECEGFYKVFKQLLPICFLKTDIAEIGLKQFKENHKYSAPCMVNGALAAELALKYLIFRDTFTFATCHSLSNLYEMIPAKDKNALDTLLSKGERLPDKTVQESIIDLKDHFVEWRYSYEYLPSMTIFFKTFVCTVCDYVINDVVR